MVKESSTSVQIGGEDHNSADRENDDHREPGAGVIVTSSRHSGAPKNSRPTNGIWGEVDRGMRHAVLRIAVAHGQEQKLTTMQFAIGINT